MEACYQMNDIFYRIKNYNNMKGLWSHTPMKSYFEVKHNNRCFGQVHSIRSCYKAVGIFVKSGFG